MILGIDLGTTYSAVAAVTGPGGPTVLPNRLGELTTPSVVRFTSAGEVIVGTAARDALAFDQDNTVALVKRQMGTEFDMRFHGTTHTPESVSALILRSLVDAAGVHLGHDGDVRAVVTVPAYFGIREREATYQAARLAGIEVLELLSEPVAAALHYGCTPAARAGDAVLVYDLGGGTFDTTVLRVDADDVRVVATDGDSKLGGADWDERLTDYLIESFIRGAGEPTDEDAFTARTAAATEGIKRALSSRTVHRAVLRDGDASVTVELDRATMRELGADLVARTLAITRRCLESARGKGVHGVDQVVLVGGATRMPAIAEAVQAEFGLKPQIVDPDLAVVLGAARRAHEIASTGRATARSVVPRSFGVLIDDSHDPAGGTAIVHVVHHNEPLPARASIRLATIVNHQRRVRVQVYEQAGDIPSTATTDNRRVLDGILEGLPELPAASPIDLEIGVDTDGLLSVSAVEPRSGNTLTLRAYVDGVVDNAASGRLETTINGLAIGY
ncbi:Hsp70 family protein [Actinokineospora sp. NBRC 105648]|uniref:Hsp70 family protein n=1 Tax=Actinokineospora sp. NBRC 105648 TaxID=3032206 RepID=UPI0024A600EE|nr:Hsp70 family protein [Actinokineospora sp. NBRC 105648]GLZ42326.1 chaperone protein DnaK [Actinokineospora sp. NBRC 105648]